MTNQVDIQINTKGEQAATQALQKTQKAGTDAAQSISGIGTTARGVLAAGYIEQIGVSARTQLSSATAAASDLGESLNAVNKIFGEQAEAIHEWGRTSANSYGLSQRAFNQLAVPLGAGLKNAGIDLATVSKLTIQLTERSADMASVFNTDVSQALEAIQAGLRGESDPLEQFGVGLNEAAVTAEALAMSGKKVASELNNQDKALARVNLIMKQTEATAGDFVETSDSLANATRIANAQLEEAKAKMGQALLPILAEMAKVLGVVAEAFSSLPSGVQATVGIVLALGAAFLILAPRIMAARDAVREMNFSWAQSDSRMGRTVQTIGIAAGRLAAFTVAAQVAGSALGSDLNPQVEELAENLVNYTKTQKAAGEAARLFDDDLSRFGRDARVLDTSFWDSTGKKIGKFFEDWAGVSNVADSSIRKSEERIRAIDSALAHLVSQGRGEEAKRIFDQLAKEAGEAGVGIEDITKGLPEYAAAQAKANRETEKTTGAIKGEIIALEDLADALRAQADPVFALIQAQENLVEAQKAYNQAVEEHGRKSPEAAALLREMAGTAIELAGASSEAQGVFQGKLTPAMRQVLTQAGFTTAQLAALEKQFKEATAAGDAFSKGYNASISVSYRDNRGGSNRNVPVFSEFQSGIGGRQSGGYGSGMVMAGEHGQPELVDLGTHGRVYNAAETRGLLEGQGNGPVEVRVVLDVQGADREFVQFFKKVVDVEGDGDVSDAFNRRRR